MQVLENPKVERGLKTGKVLTKAAALTSRGLMEACMALAKEKVIKFQ